jgi:hypothetical protein
VAKLLAVVLGAGGSLDCVAEGGRAEFDPNWRPPLTKDLFESRANFNRILTKYPKVSALSEIIRTRLKESENLEDVLRDLMSTSNLQVKKQVWEVTFYLQELLWAVSDRFVISGGTKYDTLVRSLLVSGFDRILFFTLNYDLLLDRALCKFEDIMFRSMKDYLPDSRKWSLIKPHGSVNWGRQFLNARADTQNPDLVLAALGQEPDLAEDVEVVTSGLQGIENNQRSYDGRMFFPAMALPARGEKSFVCPEQHLEEADRFFAECKNFLFVGFSGLDPHVLDLFKGVSSVETLRIVNGAGKDGSELYEKLLSKNGEFRPLDAESGDGPIFEGGFRAFMESPLFGKLIGGYAADQRKGR